MQEYRYQGSFLFLLRNDNPFAFKCFQGIIHQVKRAKTVLKPAVIRSGVDKACKSKLLDVPQSLEPGMLNDIVNQIARQAYESIHRIVYYLSFVDNVYHPESIWPTKLYKKNAFLL
jgi:hypothetical protein